ncbi:glycohydrolase toxin TNT-related protein [Agromyces sp. LHK192]|uniref:glycohydrolase toxin TNT-related protein n=1 Tax=Agromyces sp. LHK192 TaxID=2498704 RepID=UPI000FDC69D3|nr:glycohydrolase toxin TNT-related protein [Agromyces sp. LHK192]
MTTVQLNPARLATDASSLGNLATRLRAAADSAESALSGTTYMAGDDEAAEVFAHGQGTGGQGYDDYSVLVLKNVRSAAGFVEMLEAAVNNTGRAYDGVQLSGAGRDPGSSAIAELKPSASTPTGSVPTSYGEGPQEGLGEFADFVMDKLREYGVTLPCADSGKLASAASAWTGLENGLVPIASSLRSDLGSVSGFRLPQQHSIQESRDKLATWIDEVAESAGGMRDYVGEMQKNVEQAWHEIRWFLAQMAIEIAAEIAVGALLGAISFGAGAVAMAAKILVTVGKWVLKIIDKCKDLARIMRAIGSSAARVGNRLKVLLGKAVNDAVAAGVASTASSSLVNVIRLNSGHELDANYQAQNVWTSAATSALGGGAGRFAGGAVDAVRRGPNFGNFDNPTSLHGDIIGGGVDGLVSTAAGSALFGENDSMEGAIVLGALMGGAMHFAPGGGGGNTPNAPSGAGGAPGNPNMPTPGAGSPAAPTTPGGGGGVNVSGDGTPTPGGGGGGSSNAGGGGGVDVNADAPTPGGGTGDSGNAGGGGVDAPSIDAPSVDGPAADAPNVDAPAVDAPSVDAPAVDAPNVDAPNVDAPNVDAPAVDAPNVDAPAVDAPNVDAPAVDAPNVDAPAVDAPNVDAPAVDAPNVDAPAVDAPNVDAPAVDAPNVDAPAVDAPNVDAPNVDAPNVDAPAVDAPNVDAPAVDAPTADAPSADAPAVDAPAVDGPATDATAGDGSTPVAGVATAAANSANAVGAADPVDLDAPASSDGSAADANDADPAQTESTDAEASDAEASDAEASDADAADAAEAAVATAASGGAAAVAAGALALKRPTLGVPSTQAPTAKPGASTNAPSDIHGVGTPTGGDGSAPGDGSTPGDGPTGDGSSTTPDSGASDANASETAPSNPPTKLTLKEILDALKQINPNFDPTNPKSEFNNNCGNTSSILNDVLNGKPVSEAGIGTLEIPEMEARTGLPQTEMTPQQIIDSLVAQGPGSHCVVGIDRSVGSGHWFNAYFDGTTVWTLDAQDGTMSLFPPNEPNATTWDASIHPDHVAPDPATPDAAAPAATAPATNAPATPATEASPTSSTPGTEADGSAPKNGAPTSDARGDVPGARPGTPWTPEMGDPVLSDATSGPGWQRVPDRISHNPIDPNYGDVRAPGESGALADPFAHPGTVPDAIADLITDPEAPYGRDTDGTPFTRAEWEARYTDASGWAVYPGNDGGTLGSFVEYHDVDAFIRDYGDELDRMGGPWGSFLSFPDTPFEMRALPPSNLSDPYSVYRLTGHLPANMRIEVSEIAPAFGRDGGGMQVRILDGRGEPMTVDELIDRGVVARTEVDGAAGTYTTASPADGSTRTGARSDAADGAVEPARRGSPAPTGEARSPESDPDEASAEDSPEALRLLADLALEADSSTDADTTTDGSADGAVPATAATDPADLADADGNPISDETRKRIRAYRRLIAKVDEHGDPVYEPHVIRFFEGEIFNLQQHHRYDVNELHVTKPDSDVPDGGHAAPKQKSYSRVDSVDLAPAEIVSRKETQLAEVTEATGKKILADHVKFYGPGQRAVVVADTPTNRRDLTAAGVNPDSVIGRPLQGKLVLEVPVQNRPPRVAVLQRAAVLGVTVRDIRGTVWRASADGAKVVAIHADGTRTTHVIEAGGAVGG